MPIAGLLVTAVMAAGAVRLLLRRNLRRPIGVALAFGLLFAAALVPLVAVGPYLVLTKLNYFLPEALPIGLVLAAGLGAARRVAGVALRAAVVLIAAAGVAFTWYGWWLPPRPVSAAVTVDAVPNAAPVGAVERYFAHRADDPIRALRLLGPEVHEAHGLRLVDILRVPFTPERGLAPDDERALELARARVAWLELYNLVRWMQPIAAALHHRVLAVDDREDAADVTVQVTARGPTAPPDGDIGLWPFPPFEQRFTLRRSDGEWQIIAIAQRDVVDENSVQAFVASPTLAALNHLRALGWRPSWESAIAAVLAPPN